MSSGFYDQRGNWVPQRAPVVAWVCCARCTGDMFVEPQTLPASSGLPGDGPWVYCKTCKPVVDAEIAARPVEVGARCVHVSYQRGPFADMVIREIDGDRIKVSRLGAPDGVPGSAHAFHHTVGMTWFRRDELIMKGM
jgi:hypothetical protein